MEKAQELLEKIEAYAFECKGCYLVNCAEWQELKALLSTRFHQEWGQLAALFYSLGPMPLDADFSARLRGASYIPDEEKMKAFVLRYRSALCQIIERGKFPVCRTAELLYIAYLLRNRPGAATEWGVSRDVAEEIAMHLGFSLGNMY